MKYISRVPKVIETEKKRKKRKKKTPKLPLIQRSMRRTGQGSFWWNGKLAGHGYRQHDHDGIGGEGN